MIHRYHFFSFHPPNRMISSIPFFVLLGVNLYPLYSDIQIYRRLSTIRSYFTAGSRRAARRPYRACLAALLDPAVLFLFARSHLQMEFFQLFFVDGRGRVHEQVNGGLRLGEGDDFANILLVGQQHDQAVDAQGNAAVWGRAVLEGFEHVTELLPDLLIAHVHKREDFALEFGDVDTHAATANFVAVADNVILLRANIQRVSIEPLDMGLVHAGEGVVFGFVPLLLLVEMQQRKVDDPA